MGPFEYRTDGADPELDTLAQADDAVDPTTKREDARFIRMPRSRPATLGEGEGARPEGPIVPTLLPGPREGSAGEQPRDARAPGGSNIRTGPAKGGRRNLGATISIAGAVAITMLLAAWGGNSLAYFAYLNWRNVPFVQPSKLTAKPSSSELEAQRQKAVKLIENGDIAWGRLLLKQGVDATDPASLFALAETYDPEILAKRGAFGVKGDLTKARELYFLARANGSTAAAERLETLR